MYRPLIVLSPQAMPMEEPFRASYHYTNAFNTTAIRRAGGIPLLPAYLTQPEAEVLLRRTDGLLLTGGNDVDPALYGETPLEATKGLQPDRDQSDYVLLQTALALHKPIFCICRGFQLVNVYFGGSLWQDIPTQVQTDLAHSRYADYALETAHTVRAVADTPLARLLGTEPFPVNSLHHQAIRTLAPRLRPMAYAEDGIPEAWYLPEEDQWLRGVQWHPEMLAHSPRADAILQDFVAACAKNHGR